MRVTASVAVDRPKAMWAAQGLLAESFDRRVPNSSQALSAANVHAELVPFCAGDVVSKIVTYVPTAAVSANVTLLKVGLYSGTTLVASSADNRANFSTNFAMVATTLTSAYTIPSNGGYYLAILCTGTSTPTLLAANHADSTAMAAPVSGASILSVLQNGQTDLPATATWSANTLKPIWIAAA